MSTTDWSWFVVEVEPSSEPSKSFLFIYLFIIIIIFRLFNSNATHFFLRPCVSIGYGEVYASGHKIANCDKGYKYNLQ
jgi:hypothetical protein